MVVDFNKGAVKFSGAYSDDPNITVPIAELGNDKDKISGAQSRQPVEMAGIELTGDNNSETLGINFVDTKSQRSLFDIVVPARITIDPDRLKQHITNPPYKFTR